LLRGDKARCIYAPPAIINKKNVCNKDSERGVNCCLIGRVLLFSLAVSKYKIVF
jgi:hypothetical protein